MSESRRPRGTRVIVIWTLATVEFLEYLAPRDGRPAPQDARANDLAH